MMWNRHYRESDIDLPAPVTGGLRWSTPPRNLFAHLRGEIHKPVDNWAQVEAEEAEEARQAAEARERSARPQTEPAAALGPHFTTTPPEEARAGGEYVYQAKAFAASVSGFTWFLEKAPPGMAVDRHTGRITWTPQDGGYAEVVLGARTAHGRMSRQSWTIRIRRAAAVRAPRPSPRFKAALLRKAQSVRIRPAPALRPAWREPLRRPEKTVRTASPPGMRPGAALPLRL